MIRTPSGRNTFKIISWNADSVLNKIDELTAYIAENDPDVVALQETFLRPCLDLNIANFTTHRNDRMTHRGGGTAILVKNSIPHHSIQINTNTVETTTIVIESQPSNVAICSLYNPPGSPVRNLIPDLLKIFRNRSQCIIVGDYNAKHTSWSVATVNNPAGNALARFVRTSGFLLLAPQEFQSATLDLGISCGLNTGGLPRSFQRPQPCSLRNPQISNSEGIEQAILNFNSHIHTAVNQASKFKPILNSMSNVPYETRLKIREKNPPTQALAKDPIPSTQGGSQPTSKIYSYRPEKIKRAYLGLPLGGCQH
ncbi:putative RNA-directed DNA polymerase from transposon X-element [Trichonephila inaurata madagascariensis]|uniref:Putative RNA-directed DNA polymerase from transposon X-element n=1 Tax=Trichonephila inaurata madagascariensis TaxID=2747483 RepID=A0A8X6Y8Q9_9ARAC|nr:putative RNA-directed DNA polymerase from transposon X-element [Trichonephila inaurata madagascariensis]